MSSRFTIKTVPDIRWRVWLPDLRLRQFPIYDNEYDFPIYDTDSSRYTMESMTSRFTIRTVPDIRWRVWVPDLRLREFPIYDGSENINERKEKRDNRGYKSTRGSNTVSSALGPFFTHLRPAINLSLSNRYHSRAIFHGNIGASRVSVLCQSLYYSRPFNTRYGKAVEELRVRVRVCVCVCVCVCVTMGGGRGEREGGYLSC